MAKVYLDANESFTVVNNNISVYGTTGNEKVTIGAGVTGAIIDQNTEALVFSGSASTYSFMQAGNKIRVYDASGTTLLVTIPVQGDADGTVFTFSDGTVSAILSAGVMTLGGLAVGSTATPLNLFGGGNSAFTVAVSAAGTSSAANGDYTYNVAAGNYTYNITGFGAGDKINFPAGNSPSVDNGDFSDGAVDLMWSSGGQTATIHLTGISTANDAKLNNVADFITVFGAGTINSTGGTSGTPTATYSLTSAATSVNEGSTATFNLVTTNVTDGTTLAYTLSGTNITAADITGGSLTGTATVTGNKATISVPIAADVTTEGSETLSVTLTGKSATASTIINDTSTGAIIVPVSAAGSYDASTASVTFNVSAGTYTYNISGFGAGDILKAPTGHTVSVENNSYTDGEVEISWSSASGTTATIHLTGISNANDVKLNTVSDFSAVFGAGTII
jgi:hypothetical protein